MDPVNLASWQREKRISGNLRKFKKYIWVLQRNLIIDTFDYGHCGLLWNQIAS